MQGYRKKPSWIYGIAWGYLALPLLTLYQFYVKLEASWPLLREVLVSPFFLTELFGAGTAALAIFAVTRFSFFYFLCLSFYAIGLKIYNLQQNALFEFPFDLVVILFWFSITLLFLFTTLRIPYLNPNLRWWTQPKRYPFFARGTLLFEGLMFPVVTLDVSSGGVFLKLDERAFSGLEQKGEAEGKGSEERRTQEAIGEVLLSDPQMRAVRNRLFCYPHHLGDRVRIRAQTPPGAQRLFSNQILESNAEVAWTPKPNSPYRYGLGLKFTDLRATDKRRLRQYSEFLKQMGLREKLR